MNWKAIEKIAKNPDMQWFLKQKEVAVLLGCTRQLAAAFLQENSVPYYWDTVRQIGVNRMDRRKELKEQYKNRKVVGGIYRIINKENGRFYLQSTDDMQATHNWFRSCRTSGGCSLPHIQEDWKKFGMDAFYVEELDLLEKGKLQTREEFASDLKTLLEMWSEKLPKENRY